MARHPIVGGNWKKHLDLERATGLARDLGARLGSFHAAETVIFPSFPFLHPVWSLLRDRAVRLGAQDVHPGGEGAFTGAVGATMLRSVGCTHVLVGHSERRHVFGDDDAQVAAKLTAALEAGLVPVLCLGETLREREGGQTRSVLGRQLATALAGHSAASLSRLVIAYEPVWAIGTGVTATPAQAQETHAWIREDLQAHLGADFAQATRIQYGGSVKPANAAELLAQPDIDGALVGGASLDATSFAAIVQAAARRA